MILRRGILVAVLLVFSVSLISAQDEESTADFAWVRAAHLSSDGPAFDVYVDDELAIENLTYMDVSPYFALDTGSYTLAFVPAGEPIDAAIGQAPLDFEAGSTYLMAPAGRLVDNSFGFATFNETSLLQSAFEANPEMGELGELANLLLIHALSDGPTMALITQTAEIVTTDIEFGSYYASPVGPGRYPLLLTTNDAENRIIYNDLNPFTFNSGILYLVAAVGSIQDPELVIATSGTKTLQDLIMESETTSIMAAALAATGFMDELGTDAPVTLFIPNDEAFAAAGLNADDLLADPAALEDILRLHMVEGTVTFDELAASDTITTMLGTDITISPADEEGNLILNDRVNLNFVGIQALNGIIFLIDDVLEMPE